MPNEITQADTWTADQFAQKWDADPHRTVKRLIATLAAHRIAHEAPLLARNAELEAHIKALVTAVCYADPPKLFNGVLCHEARVPIEFIISARAALATKEPSHD